MCSSGMCRTHSDDLVAAGVGVAVLHCGAVGRGIEGRGLDGGRRWVGRRGDCILSETVRRRGRGRGHCEEKNVTKQAAKTNNFRSQLIPSMCPLYSRSHARRHSQTAPSIPPGHVNLLHHVLQRPAVRSTERYAQSRLSQPISPLPSVRRPRPKLLRRRRR